MRTSLIMCGLALGAAAGIAPAQDAPAPPAAPSTGPAAVLAKGRVSVVNVRAVLQLKGQLGPRSLDQESRAQGQGIVVDGSGLILASSQVLRPAIRFGRMRMPMPDTVSATPTSLKILREGDETEHDAFLVATDSELGLAFLQLSKPLEKPLTAVDLAASAKPAIGERLLAVSRLGKLFDHAPFLQEAFVAGRITTPRKAWVLGGSGTTAVGMPFFNTSGQLVGVLTTLSVENEAGATQQRQFLLPPRPVRTAVGRALARAKELIAQRAAETGKKDEPTPDEGNEGF